MLEAGVLIEGKYEVLAKLREGGMGSVFKVRHRLLDEVRVVKVMRSPLAGDGDLRRRFLDEARTATRLKHPNLVAVHDFAVDEGGTAYLVMEFVDGVPLRDLVRAQGPLAVPLVLEVAHQALGALGYLHRKGVVHRDVAPDNLMLTHDEAGAPLVKLIDLGIAKAVDGSSERTSTGIFLGKLGYASPEQFGVLPPGESIDGRSDLYSLGVVLYELLSGVKPFGGGGTAGAMLARLFQEPTPWEESDPRGRVPADVRAVVRRAMERERERRYRSAEEFDADVRALLAVQEELAGEDATAHLVLPFPLAEPAPPGTVSPGAQALLDRQFAATRTPSRRGTQSIPPPVPPPPAASQAPPPVAPAVVSTPSPPQPPPRPPATVGGPRPPRGARVALLVVGGCVVAAGAAWAGLFLRPRPERVVEVPRAAATPVPVPPAATPVPRATRPPPSPPSPGPEATRPPLKVAVAPPRPAPRDAPAREPVPSRITVETRRAQPAAPPYEPPPEAVPRAAPATPPPPAATPVPPAPQPPVRAAEPVRPAAPPPEAPVQEPSPEAAIRQTLALYVKGQNTLDADLLSRVDAGLGADRKVQLKRAFAGYASQSYELGPASVDVTGPGEAVARGRVSRTVVPRIGARIEDTRTVTFRLRRRGDGWVIVAVE